MLTENRITANRITANRITANRIAANRIAATRISGSRLTVNAAANDLLATAEGRDVFSVLVGCAIPGDTTLVATVDGVEFEFPGELGLVRDWLYHPLDSRGKGWVSACVFAKINENDNVHVAISMRGPNPALAFDLDEKATFSVEEGAFYGDLFTPLDQPIQWIACRGAGQAAGDSGLLERVCATEDPANPGFTKCGFFFAGDCGDFSPRFACDHFSENGEFYRGCHASPVNLRRPFQSVSDPGYGEGGDQERSRVFREVATTYVQP